MHNKGQLSDKISDCLLIFHWVCLWVAVCLVYYLMVDYQLTNIFITIQVNLLKI